MTPKYYFAAVFALLLLWAGYAAAREVLDVPPPPSPFEQAPAR